jgi:WD40 repeat protein
MGDFTFMGAYSYVRSAFPIKLDPTINYLNRNPSTPRLASSSKDGTVRVWSTVTRRVEYTLGGHTASVNVVRWGGGSPGGGGVLYTASSDRTVRVWDANGVRLFKISFHFFNPAISRANYTTR